MNERNHTLRLAQSYLRTLAEQEPMVEDGYLNYGESRLAYGYRAAARKLEALMEPEEGEE